MNTDPVSAQVSEARQAIFRLASFPEDEPDLRITKTLEICHAQTNTQKVLSHLTCGCLFSRHVYNERTNLLSVYRRLVATLKIISLQPEFQQESPLRKACYNAAKVFNGVLANCASHRAGSPSQHVLTSLTIDLDRLLADFKREASGQTNQMSFPRLPDGSIDYHSLFSPLGSPEGSPSIMRERNSGSSA